MRFVRFVLVGAALASIATSRLSAEAIVTAPLPASTLDDSQPLQVYAIDLDRTTDGTLTGYVTARLELSAAAGSSRSAELDITLRGADGAEAKLAVTVPAGALSLEHMVQLPVWTVCERESPCREELTLEIVRRTAADDPAVTVTGEVEADAYTTSDDDQPEIAIGVTAL